MFPAALNHARETPWLEAREADLLEGARLRYGGLSRLLSPVAWHARVAGAVELLREVARAEPETAAVQARLWSRLQLEGGGAGPLRERLCQLEQTRERLVKRAARRLGREADRPLLDLLAGLEEAALVAADPPEDPRAAWALARRLIPRNLPLLETAVACARSLHPFASRGPRQPGLVSLAPEPELGRVLEATSAARAAIEAIRARLLRLDLSGRVESVVWTQARAVPRGFGHGGAEQLSAALFWTDLADSRLGTLAGQLVAPVAVREEEVQPLLRAWVRAGGRDLPRLPAGTGETPARTALLQLALLASVPSAAPLREPPPETREAWVRAAGAEVPADPDLQSLTGSLRALLLREGHPLAAEASLDALFAAREDLAATV